MFQLLCVRMSITALRPADISEWTFASTDCSMHDIPSCNIFMPMLACTNIYTKKWHITNISVLIDQNVKALVKNFINDKFKIWKLVCNFNLLGEVHLLF
jgi:hypothetical protein